MSFEAKPPRDEIREVTDPRALRALAHPVRLALIEALTIDGPLTATQVADRVGESPSSCSFHLRQLAKFGFVEEAGGGTGRARPWRMTSIGFRFSTEPAGAEERVVAQSVGSLLRSRQIARYETWTATRESYPPEWRRAAIDSEFGFWLTADELATLGEEITTLLMERFRERITDPSTRPENALPVELLTFGYPMRAPEGPRPPDEPRP